MTRDELLRITADFNSNVMEDGNLTFTLGWHSIILRYYKKKSQNNVIDMDLVKVSETEEGKLEIYPEYYEKVPADHQSSLFNVITEFSNTPINKRRG